MISYLDLTLKLRYGEPQCGYDQLLVPIHRAIPSQLLRAVQAELVGNVPTPVAVLGVLGFVQGQVVTAVLVLVEFVVALHAQTEHLIWVHAAGRYGGDGHL